MINAFASNAAGSDFCSANLSVEGSKPLSRHSSWRKPERRPSKRIKMEGSTVQSETLPTYASLAVESDSFENSLENTLDEKSEEKTFDKKTSESDLTKSSGYASLLATSTKKPAPKPSFTST